MGCNIHAFAHRLTVLSMACLASTGFIICALSGFGCSFIEIQSLPGRNIGNSNGGDVFVDETNIQQAYLGVQCLTGADDMFQGDSSEDDDRLWDISRLFLYISLALGGTTTLFAWLLSFCVRPTACRWRVLSILAACSAVFQIPIFLVLESNNCNFDISRQTCTFSTGAYLNIVSIAIWIIMTIWVQLLRVPRWDDELDAWRVNGRNNNGGGGGSGQRGGTTIMIPTPKNANDSRDGTEETDFALSSPTQQQQQQQQQSPLDHLDTTRENATTASNPNLSNTSTILCNAMEHLKGSNDEDDDENKNSINDDDLENQRRNEKDETKIRRSSSIREIITTKSTKKFPSPSPPPRCMIILPPSIDQFAVTEVEEDTSIEVAAVHDAFCVSEAKKNSFIGSWGSSMNRKRSKPTNDSNILPRSLYAVNVNDNSNNNTENNNKSDDQNTAAAVVKYFTKDIPRIEISSRSGKENKSSQQQHYPQSSCITTNTDVVHYNDDSDNEFRDNNTVGGGGVIRSDKSSSTNRTAPGFKISCVYDDGTRHETHFPSLTSCCLGLVTDAADNDDEPADHPVCFEVADGNNNGDGDSHDVEYLVKKLRKEEKAAANRKSKRNMAPIPSFEFDKSSSLLTMGKNDDDNNNNTNSNYDGTANDDISEMTRGSGLVSTLSEVLDDVDLRHSSREVLDDLAKYY